MTVKKNWHLAVEMEKKDNITATYGFSPSREISCFLDVWILWGRGLRGWRTCLGYHRSTRYFSIHEREHRSRFSTPGTGTWQKVFAEGMNFIDVTRNNNQTEWQRNREYASELSNRASHSWLSVIFHGPLWTCLSHSQGTDILPNSRSHKYT